MSSTEAAQQAAIVTIGNEILSGDVEDFKGLWLARELYSLGVDVGIMLSLPDEKRLVAAHLRGLARRYHPVIVTGGIGTTLDDITRQAVALATGRPLEIHEDVVARMEALGGASLSPTQRRLAELPRGCGLIPNRIGRAPGFIVGSIYVFPGVPEMLRDMFPGIAGEFRSTPFKSKTLISSCRESEIAHLLEELDEHFPEVRIGSYPKRDGKAWRVEIVLKSKDPNRLESASAWLGERLPGQPTA